MRAIRVCAHATALVFAAGLTAACGGAEPAPVPAEKIQPTTVGEMSPEEAGGMSAEASTLKEAEASSAAPHGGTLVKLGTVGQLEFVLDPSSGLLTAYVLDAAGAAVTRIPAKTITIEVTPAGGTATTVTLASTANGLTGDTVGNSSQFGGVSPALKGATAFVATVKNATIGGQTFTDVTFGYPYNGER